MSLTRRVAIAIAVSVFMAFLVSVVIQSLSLWQTLDARAHVRNRETAALLASALGQQHGDAAATLAVAEGLLSQGQLRSVQLQTAEGALLVNLRQPQRPMRAPDWFAAALPMSASQAQAPVRDGGRDIGMLRLDADTVWATDALWDACVRAAIWASLMAILAASVAAWALRAWQRLLLATLAQAQALETVQLVEPGEPPLPELTGLTRSINATVHRLRGVFAAQAEQVALLQRQAQLDAVTGLPLRQHFVGQLQQRLAEPGGPGMALLLVRVLQLEALNPRLGHEGTDRLLSAIADVLLTYVERVSGTIAGRLNGCDFALCLPVPGVAMETAASLRAALAAAPTLRNGGADVVVGGIDAVHDLSASAALAAADAALAQAEAGAELGGGKLSAPVLESEGDPAIGATGARAWREQISAALAEGRAQLAEFTVVDALGREIHLECPLRVQLSRNGDYQAAERWLALARRSRLMPQVDLAALDLALRATELDGRARAVHASPVSLSAPGFIAEVAGRLAATPAAARLLSVECVHGLRPTAPGVAPLAAAVAAWRPWGVRVGVEHAGAAPQALPALQAAGIAYVKVDARHLRGLAADAAVRGYAQSLLALIHGLGLSAFAEGIDDVTDLSALWALGFDGATGPAVRAMAKVSSAP